MRGQWTDAGAVISVWLGLQNTADSEARILFLQQFLVEEQ